MAAVNDLLNPAPASQSGPPQAQESSQNECACGQKVSTDALLICSSDTESSERTGFAPELFQTDGSTNVEHIKKEERRNSDDAVALPVERRESFASATSLHEDGKDSSPTTMRAPSDKPKKSHIDLSKKDSRHSSKNEGQHTDRRYLCYLCNKLFTRRRSVRDHISKIHGTKTWEPTRSLEIIVEPNTGEPIESLEDQVAKGGATPLEKSSSRAEKIIEENDEEEVEPPTIKPEPSIESRSQSVDPGVSTPVIGKKRPFPINKKGTAKVKTTHKRPRIVDSETSTPFRSPSVASVPRGPASKLSKATQSPSSSRAASIDPSASPSSSVATPDSTNDDGEIFCICRKGDNHTWMIACDGGCEEWFHGNCVNIRERDGELIDKYICPNCKREGLHTTWKRMCRRKGCRKPAKVFADPPSKYCSRECGRMFFVEFIKKGDPDVWATRDGQYIIEMEKPKKKKKKRRLEEKKEKLRGDITPIIEGSRPHTPAYSDDEKSEYETDSSLDEDMLPNRGGALRAAEVKALVEKCKTIEQWRELGRKPVTPPRDNDEMDVDNRTDIKYEFDDFETEKLASIKSEKARLDERSSMLTARERILDLVKERSVKITDEVKKNNPKQKDLCGYDPRLAWSDEQFLSWYNNAGGKGILESGTMDDPVSSSNGNTDKAMTNGVNGTHESDDGDENDCDGATVLPTQGGVCIKNRCQRHGSNRWQKAQLAELRFEQDLVRRAKERLDIQEREIRERGIVRSWESRG